jgi:hypothetical protein
MHTGRGAENETLHLAPSVPLCGPARQGLDVVLQAQPALGEHDDVAMPGELGCAGRLRLQLHATFG